MDNMGSTIIRSREKTGHFSIMLNEALQSPSLSWQAKGLYAYLMTLPDDWIIYQSELPRHSTNGIQSTRRAFAELQKAGYIKATSHRQNGRFAGIVYTLYESIN